MKRAIYIGEAWENEEDGYIGYGQTGTASAVNETQWAFKSDDDRNFLFYTEELHFAE